MATMAFLPTAQWTLPGAMHDINGRGMGTAYPRLLMLGGGDDGAPKRLLLSGGRVFTDGVVDIEIWISSNGMGKIWDQVHSVSYQHNRHAVSPVHQLTHEGRFFGGSKTAEQTPCERIEGGWSGRRWGCMCGGVS